MASAQIEGKGSKEILRKLSSQLKADFEEVNDGATLSFNNANGKGKLSYLQIFPGLDLWTFNLSLSRTIQLTSINNWNDSLHIIFCLEGGVEHKFDSEKDWKKIIRFQNVIVGTKKPNASSFRLPDQTKIQMTIITITDELKKFRSEKQRGFLPTLLSDTLEGFKKDETYSYFGDISAAAEHMVRNIVKTKPIGLTKRLLMESAVLGVLQLQFASHNSNKDRQPQNSKFRDFETIAIVQLSEYITNNLQEDLSLARLERISGLNQKKIQAGFKHYFHESVNRFIIGVRLLKGKELIETTDYSITRIIHEIGLSSRSYFAKIFSAKYGIQPKEYRDIHHISYPTFEISYCSKAVGDLTQYDLQSIVEVAKRNNADLNVTGCLLYHQEHFFQILEGNKGDVLNIMEKIIKDSRHKDVDIVYQGIRSGRTFSKWSMAFLEKQPRFSNSYIDNVKTLDLDGLLLGNTKNKTKTKLMWEKARNVLLLQEDLVE